MSNQESGSSAERGLEAGRVQAPFPWKQEGSAARAARWARRLALLPLVAALLGSRAFAQDATAGQVADPAPQAADAVPAGEQGNAPAGTAASDPPSRVLRIAVANGNLSVEPDSTTTFAAAQLNDVLTTGDRLYADPAGQAELQGPQFAVRLGGGADLTVSAMTDTLAQFGLAAGSAHLRAYAVDPGTVLEMDTLEAAVTVLQPGDLRVDEDAAAHVTTVELVSGSAQVDGPGVSQVLTPGQRVQVHGANADTGQEAYAEPVAPGTPDALDAWDQAQDNTYASNADASSAYVNSDTVGYADLGSYGSWDSCDYGPVWFPAVAVDWVPYRHGRWMWRRPWGWTWVEGEPWGFAPFHYGRWVNWRGRWGWIPGTPGLRPVYAPALVSFAGGREFATSLGYASGFGITAWFPLGPREPFAPWYHGSTLYLNRVNASNIFNPNAAEARAFYNQRAVPVFTGVSAAHRGFANRTLATTAVPESSFVAGRSALNASLRLAPEALASAPLLHPPAAAPATVGRTARVLPPVPTQRDGSAADTSAAPAVGGTLFMQRAQPPAGVVQRGVTPAQVEAWRAAHPAVEPGRATGTRPVPTHAAPPPPARNVSPSTGAGKH